MAKDANPEVKDTSAVVEGEHNAKGLTKEQKEYGVSKEELRGKSTEAAVAQEPSTSFDERTGAIKMPWEDYNRDKNLADAEAAEKARAAAPTLSAEDDPTRTGAAQARKSADQADSTKNTGAHRNPEAS